LKNLIGLVLSCFIIASAFAQSENVKVGLIENEKLNLLYSDAQLTGTIGKKLNNLVFSHSVLVKMLDQESGQPFYAIKSEGKRGDVSVAVILVLTQVGIDLLAGGDGCEMECISTIGCQSCTQSIIVPCKSQKCSCSGGGGVLF
jgi:hypothetical protein